MSFWSECYLRPRCHFRVSVILGLGAGVGAGLGASLGAALGASICNQTGCRYPLIYV